MTQFGRRQFCLLMANVAIFQPAVLAQETTSNQGPDDQIGLLLQTQLTTIKKLRTALDTLRRSQSAGPQNPLGDLESIYLWAAWADENVERALEGQPVTPPPTSLCSGYSVPMDAVSQYVNSRVSEAEEDIQQPRYTDLFALSVSERAPLLRANFETLQNFVNDVPEFDSFRADLDDLNNKTRLYIDYYSQLSQAIENLIYFPEYFTSRQAVLCWFTIEASIIQDLNRIDENVRTAKRRIDTLQEEREELRQIWFRDHLLALRLEEADIEVERLKQRAKAEQLEAVQESSERLDDEQNQYSQESDRLRVELQAAELDAQNAENEVGNFRSLTASLTSAMNNDRQGLRQPYNLCPNNNDFNTCTHDDLKIQWTNSRQALRDSIQRNQRELDRLSRQQRDSQNLLRVLARDIDIIRNEIAAIRSRSAAIDVQREALSDELSRLLFDETEGASVDLDQLSADNMAELEFIEQNS